MSEGLPAVSVTALRLVGGACKRGVWYSGFGMAKLSNGGTVYVPEEEARGFDGCLQFCENQGYDVSDMRQTIDDWVAHGGPSVSFGLQA